MLQSRAVRAELVAGTAVFVAAFIVRLLPVFVFPSINHPDELFQSVEQAHRLVFGTGIVPWEFAYGTRSWVLPGALAGLMAISSLFGDGPNYYGPVIGAALAALGASSALCAFLWGRRFFGTSGGVVAGLLTAVWIDAVYFGPRPLADCVAAHVLVIALFASTPDRAAVVTSRRAAAAGALLILAGSLRVQLAPAVGAIGLWLAFTTFRPRWLAFIGSGLLVGLLYGAVDGITWSYPFEALWRNVVANLYYDVQAAFGVMPWYWYVSILLDYWAGLGAIMLALCLIGGVRLPQLLAAAVLIGATYTLVGHKEFRFIYPAILLAVIVSGVGLAQIASWISGRWSRPRATAATSAAVIAVAVLAQLILVSHSQPYRRLWARGRDIVMASTYVAQMSLVCGVGVLDSPTIGGYPFTGGYASFHRPVPLFWGTPKNPLDPDFSAFNTVLYYREKSIGAGYARRACFGDTCVAQRPGTCAPISVRYTSPPPRPLGNWKAEIER